MNRQMFYCFECGQPFAVDVDSGVSNHLTSSGDVDYDADEDHVPYGEKVCVLDGTECVT